MNTSFVSIFLTMALLAQPILTSCSDDEPECPVAGPSSVRLVLTPGGTLGDKGYNDDIMSGIRSVADPAGMDVITFVPASVSEVHDSLALWLADPEAPVYTVLSSDFLSDYPLANAPASPSRNILQLETGEVLGGKVPACQIRGYGCAFLAGVVAYEMMKADSVAYVAGMRNHAYIDECGRGFADGFREAGGKGVAIRYLADGSEGFDMRDGAYELAAELYARYPFVLMLAGGSNLGLYDYLNDHPDEGLYTAGVDMDQSALSPAIVGSLVKEMGKCVADYLTDWIAGKEIPTLRIFGLDSGYIRFAIAPAYEVRLNVALEEYLPIAVGKEEEILYD
ncbi:BMP family ABC transporter substrate-binding protein [Parabacteroides sp.]